MGRRAADDYLVPLTLANGTETSLPKSVVEALPEAAAWMSWLIASNRVVLTTASRYATAMARLKREGVIWTDTAKLKRFPDATAAGHYLRWWTETYDARVHRLLKAIPGHQLRDGVRRLRVSSLVPPTEGKQIPIGRGAPKIIHTGTGWRNSPGDPIWGPAPGWTLHVPPHDVPVHADPCADCTAIQLDDAQVQLLASVFRDVWGPAADLTTVPPDAFLIGPPPPATLTRDPGEAAGEVLALVPRGAVADALTGLHASVVEQVGTFRDRLRERQPRTLVLNRDVIGSRLDEVLQAVRDAWGAAPSPVASVAEAPDDGVAEADLPH